jgi:STE24 endopeptidase
MIFLPKVLVLAWRCQKLEECPSVSLALIERLKALCKKAKFTYAGFYVWNVMEGSMNAAILGIVSKFRYVMFTKKLLERLHENAILAILAHEIGHKRHHHLLIYPLILMGMVLSSIFISDQFLEYIHTNFTLDQILSPATREAFLPFLAFLPFIAASAVYYRFIFGYFSRLFERQADLFVFELDLDPKYLIEALNEIGHGAGGIHNHPNWHHHSIQERIDFLKRAEKDRSLIAKHHKKVKWSLTLYLALLILALTLWITG